MHTTVEFIEMSAYNRPKVILAGVCHAALKQKSKNFLRINQKIYFFETHFWMQKCLVDMIFIIFLSTHYVSQKTRKNLSGACYKLVIPFTV